MTYLTIMPENCDNIRTGIVELLKAARSAAARNVNSIMTATYWEIGRRIVIFEQGEKQRDEYGEQIVEQVARDLTQQFGRGFGQTNLKQMCSFYRAWPEPRIRQTLSDKFATSNNINALDDASSSTLVLTNRFALPCSAYVRLLSLKNPEARNFYETEALRSGWSVRQLDRLINSQFYERIALSKNIAAMLQKAETAEPGMQSRPKLSCRSRVFPSPFTLPCHCRFEGWAIQPRIRRLWKAGRYEKRGIDLPEFRGLPMLILNITSHRILSAKALKPVQQFSILLP